MRLETKPTQNNGQKHKLNTNLTKKLLTLKLATYVRYIPCIKFDQRETYTKIKKLLVQNLNKTENLIHQKTYSLTGERRSVENSGLHFNERSVSAPKFQFSPVGQCLIQPLLLEPISQFEPKQPYQMSTLGPTSARGSKSAQSR